MSTTKTSKHVSPLFDLSWKHGEGSTSSRSVSRRENEVKSMTHGDRRSVR